MSRRGGTLLAGVLVAAGALGGCGVPTSSEVQYVAPGPVAGAVSPDGGEAPPEPDEAVTPEQQVANFLHAAAGSPETAAERVRDFIRSGERERWNPEQQIRVVRLLDAPFISPAAGGYRVELSVQQVGTLHPSGYLDTATGGPSRYEFKLVEESSPNVDGTAVSTRLWISDPPPVILLEDRALADPRYYYPTPIYFWDERHEALVPDLRWLPQAGEPVDRHPLIVLQWLLGGPAPSLSRLEGLPGGTQLVGAPTREEDGRLVVNLNAAALGDRPVDDLATQLVWSLRPLRTGSEVELRIDDQPQTSPPRARPWAQADPVRLAVLDGVIRQFSSGEATSAQVLLSETVNAGVVAAALAGEELAAVVRQDGSAGAERLSVVRTADGAEPEEESTGLVADDIGQPVWLRDGDDGLGLVVAGGHLHRFTAGGGAARVSVSGLDGPVTAMAVSPERRRVALVADDQLYIALVQLDGEEVVVENPRALPTTVENLAGVAFSHEHQLVVAGEKDDRVGLYSLTVDGGWEEPLFALGNATVTSLVAHPQEDPNLVDVMYEANGQAYTYSGGSPDPVEAEQLLDAPEDVESSPRSPFFMDW